MPLNIQQHWLFARKNLSDTENDAFMSSANIYQIYYDEPSRQALDRGFIPLNNTDNLRPDWSELWVIRRFLLNTPLIEDQWYGFLSPKFTAKTGLNSSQVQQFVNASSPDTDVLLLSPYWDINAFFLNVFTQGEYWHHGLIDIAEQFFLATGTSVDLRSLVMSSSSTVYCNYFLAKPKFWRRWLKLAEQLFQFTENTEHPFSVALTAKTFHNDVMDFSMKVFLQERLASFLISTEGWTTRNYPIFQLRGIHTELIPFRSDLISCDALKSQYCRSGATEYINEYQRLIASINQRISLSKTTDQNSNMAHNQQRFFVNGVKQFLPSYFQDRKVLEIGSLNLNGSVREFFTDCSYLGLDVGPGPDVDEVCHGENYDAPANHFDTVISCEAMEHNPGWQKTWLNMLRLLKSDGLMIMTCATLGRRQHGTDSYQPFDSPLTSAMGQNHYKNLEATDFLNIANPQAWFSVWGFYVDGSSHDLYFFGLGLEAPEAVREQANHLKNALQDHYYRINTLGMY